MFVESGGWQSVHLLMREKSYRGDAVLAGLAANEEIALTIRVVSEEGDEDE